MHTTIVSTDTLSTRLDHAWVIVDCRFDLQNEQWGHEQYLVAHIPGAVYASLSHDMAGPKTGILNSSFLVIMRRRPRTTRKSTGMSRWLWWFDMTT